MLKRIVSLLLGAMMLTLLCGCSSRGDAPSGQPYAEGTVIYSPSGLSLSCAALVGKNGEASGCLFEVTVHTKDAELNASDGSDILLSELRPGDRVRVYYSGDIMETWPPQINAQRVVLSESIEQGSFYYAARSNPSTGCSWMPSISEPDALEISDNGLLFKEDVVSASTQSRDGSDGVEYWVFRALKPGKVTVTMRYGHAWEKPDVNGLPSFYEQRVLEFDISDDNVITLESEETMFPK